MAAYFFQDYRSELSNHDRWQLRYEDIQRKVNSVTPEQVINMAQLARMFPIIEPGVIRGLGQGGYTANDPVTHFAVKQSLLRNQERTGDWSGEKGKRRYSGKPVPERRRSTGSPELDYLLRDHPSEGLQEDLKDAERFGLFDPNSKMLIEPAGDSSDERKFFFERMVDKLAHASGEPITYLDRSGSLVSWHPSFTSGPIPVQGEMVGSSRRSPSLFDIGEPTPEQGAAFRERQQELGGASQVPLPDDTPELLATKQFLSQIFAASESYQAAHKAAARGITDINAQTAGPSSLPGPLQAITEAIQPVARGTFAAFEAPIQEIQGFARNVAAEVRGDDPNWLESQSDLGILLPSAISGDRVDMGSGFFVDPESTVARERRRREATRGQIAGHSITVGRLLANTVTEPDTKPFQIISGLADGVVQLADPAAFGLGKTKAWQQARITFQPDEAAGSFKGIRNVVHGPTTSQWLDKNTDLVNKLSELRTPYEIADLTRGGVPVSLARDLARTRTPTEVRRVLSNAVDSGTLLTTTQLQPVSRLGRGGLQAQRKAQQQWTNFHRLVNPKYTPRSARIFRNMPQTRLDLSNPDQIANELVRSMINAHGTDEDVAAVYNAVANATSKNGLFKAATDVLTRTDGILHKYGMKDPALRRYITRLYNETYNESAIGLRQEIGSDNPIWDELIFKGEPVSSGGPHLPLEHIDRYMYMPDPRAIRRMTSNFHWITAKSTGEIRLPFYAADIIMSNLLKPMWLLRAAWPIRVIGEEQLRMSAAGIDSAFSGHPLSWLALVIGHNDTRLGRTLNALTPGLAPSHTVDALGEAINLSDELKDATRQVHAQWLDEPNVIRSRNRTKYVRDNIDHRRDYNRSWASEMALLYHDPVANYVARNTFDDSVDWMLRGPGRKFRNELREGHPGQLMDRRQVEQYIQSVSDRINYMTSGDTDLIDIIKHGKFRTSKRGEEVINNVFQDPVSINPGFTRYLESKLDIGPQQIVGNTHTARGVSDDFIARWNQVLSHMYGFLMGSPTATLSRAPTFKQFYWKRAAELIYRADEASKGRIIDNAIEANLPNRTMRNLEHSAARATGDLNAADVDQLAKAYALEDTRNLLYDLSRRSQAADILRTFIPFGEAWKEVLTRWLSLGTIRGPLGVPLPGKPVRRGQQLLEGARGEDFGDFMGAPEGKGFFHQNEFGEEVFIWPGSQFLNQAVTGAPVPLPGRVAGLNMFGTILPSLGPAGQIPVAWFLQDKPDYDWWREQLLPFGGPGAEGTSTIFELEQYLPAWGKTAFKLITSGADDRTYASSVMYMAQYKYSTGEYGNSLAEQQRLMEDAKKATNKLWAIRMAGQFLLPSSPSFSWVQKAPDGSLVNQRILSEEFYALQDVDYDTAIANFVEQYGEEGVGAIVPHSRNVIYSVPTSLEGAKWVADHKDIKEEFWLTYGFFAPEGEFHYPTLMKSYQTGERDEITPKEWQRLRDTLLGNYHYDRAIQMLGGDRSLSDAERAWLREQKANIIEAYPNMNLTAGLSERPTTEQMIAELYRAKDNIVIAKTPAGKALIRYLDARDIAMEQAQSLDYVSFTTANKLAPTRNWLRSYADELLAAYPEFRRLWDMVLSREMEEDVEERE